MSIALKKVKITPNNCVLLISPHNQKDFKTIPEYGKMMRNISNLREILTSMKVPIIYTTYEPNCDDETNKVKVSSYGKKMYVIDQRNMCIPEMLGEIKEYVKNGSVPFHVILTGFETHTLVENTAITLRNLGYEVDIVADCCISRLPDNNILALSRMRDIGCQLTTTENIVAKMINEIESPEEYKNIRDQLGDRKASESMKIFGSI